MKIKTIALLTLFTLISACGFHLRGQLDISDDVEPVYISSSANSTLGIELRNLLSVNDIEITNEATNARYRVILLKESQDRRTLSVGANANAVEYQLIETVSFAIEDSSGKPVVGPKTLNERQIMNNDPDQVVSKGEEEQRLRREMKRNLAAKIARQFSAITKAR